MIADAYESSTESGKYLFIPEGLKLDNVPEEIRVEFDGQPIARQVDLSKSLPKVALDTDTARGEIMERGFYVTKVMFITRESIE